MTTKYKELPAFETNEFKVGDKVKCFDTCTNSVVINEVYRTISNYIEIRPENYLAGIEVHISCCRKLEEIKPREFAIGLEEGHPLQVLFGIPRIQSGSIEWIKVREVIE